MSVTRPIQNRPMSAYVTGTAVAAHLLVNVVHGAAHTALQVDAPSGWMPFILIVIFVGPVVGFAILLRRPLPGSFVVAASMLASLVYGVAYHFVINSSDRIDHVSGGLWAMAFHTTAALLVITEIVAIAAVMTLCARILR
jgi:hypothetical protein